MDRSRRYRAQAIIWLVAALSFGTCVPLSILFGKYGFTVLYAANTNLSVGEMLHLLSKGAEKQKWLNC